MLNKKRLAMMAVAASMMLPTNLAYLSTITPVFATDSQSAVEMVNFNSLFYLDDGTNMWRLNSNVDLSKSYKLNKVEAGIALTNPIYISKIKGLTLDLGGNTITLNDTDCTAYNKRGIWINSSEVTLTNGTLKSVHTDNLNSVIMVSGADTVLNIGSDDEADAVTLLADNRAYGVSISMSAASAANKAQVNIKNSTIETSSGITVSGDVKDRTDIEANGPTVLLDKVTITASSDGKPWENDVYTQQTENNDATFLTCSSVGIYQAGASKITVQNCNITSSSTGIETRAGTLTVKDSTVTGGKKDVKVSTRSGGSSSENVGISLNPYYSATLTGQIKMTITNSTVEGNAALALTDASGVVKSDDSNLPNITINNSTLTGTGEGENKYSAIFTTDYIPFTLTNTVAKEPITQFAPSQGPTMSPIDSEEELNGENLPYKIILDFNTSEDLGDPDKPSSSESLTISPEVLEKFTEEEDNGKKLLPIKLENLPESYQALSFDNFENGFSQTTLGKALTTTSSKVPTTDTNEILRDSDGNLVDAPKYTYKVEDLKITASEGILEADPTTIISVKVEDDSVIRFTNASSSDVEEQKDSSLIEIFETDQEEPASSEDSTINLYVKKSSLGNNKNTINQYLQSRNYHIEGDIDLSQDLVLGTDVNLDENGFIVMNLVDGKASNGGGGGGGTSRPSKPKPEEPTPTTPVVGTPTTMYRLYNKLTGEHLYTIDKNERDNLLTSDTWKDEGQGWIAPSVSDYPVYRLLNPNNGDHHYTTDKNEFDTLPTYGWVAEGIAFFSADKNNTENVILHRLYNPNATGAGSHHYTADTNERDALVAQGWKYEGTAWAGLPANK